MIAKLTLTPSGVFAARCETVGSTDEEISAIERGELAADRIAAINANLKNAAFALHAMPHVGCC